MPGLDVRTELDTNVLTGETVVRIMYRRLPARRFVRFVVVPDEGQTPVEIIAHAEEIAILHDSRSRV